MLYGVRYDIAAILIINSVFILMHIIPNPWRARKSYQSVLKILFYAVNGLFLLLEASDFIYYEFAQQRTSSHILGLKNDILGLVPQFMKDFWYILLLCIGVIAGIEWLYKKTQIRASFSYFRMNYTLQAGLGIAILGFSFIGARGGLREPLSPISATKYVDASELSLVTNTTFTVLYSLSHRKIKDLHYYDAPTCNAIFNVYKKMVSTTTDSIPAKKPNIVVLILESFSKEYIGYFNNGVGYTPYLDTLMKKSIVFTDAFANGKHSIDAIPSICAGLPALMNDAFISSAYENNSFEGIGTLLNKEGYNSLFFHGGNNGALEFDKFAQRAGFDNYYGRNEYNNESDFDGNWGIYDEPFLQFAAAKMGESEKPFYSTIFTLSSHHPFTIPLQYKGKFDPGEIPIHQPVRYADYALHQFFTTAEKMDWYDNTVFIITADHTGPLHREEFKNKVGHYAIPLIIFAPGKKWSGEKNYTVQQCDIFPTALSLAGYRGNYTSFGSGLLDTMEQKFSVNQMNNVFQYLSNGTALHFDGTEPIALFHYKDDPYLNNNLIGKGYPEETAYTEKLKAIIQTYHFCLIHNQLLPQ